VIIGKNISSIKNIIVFISKNHPISKKIRLIQRTQEYNMETPNTKKKNHDRRE